MKNIRRALVTSALALAVCGLASAGSITQTFSLPSGGDGTGWSSTNTTGVQAYDYLQDTLCVATCGTLNSVTISMTWASTGTGAATDNNPGSTGTDDYTFQNDTTVGLTFNGVKALSESTSNGLGVANTSNGNSGTGCVDASFTNKSEGNTFVETGCVDSSAIEAASGNNDGAVLSAIYTNGSMYAWFEGADTVNDLSFHGTASTVGAFVGPDWTASSAGYATEAVTVVYNYSAPSSVPEPTTLFLMGSALVGCGLLRKRIKS